MPQQMTAEFIGGTPLLLLKKVISDDMSPCNFCVFFIITNLKVFSFSVQYLEFFLLNWHTNFPRTEHM